MVYMSLNIKNQRVHDLAREAARVTGKSQTSAIEEALVHLLRKYDADPTEAERARRLARLREIGERFRTEEPELPPGPDVIRTIEDLYDDETGLPR